MASSSSKPAPADPAAAIPADAKTRIIRHMNADHQDSLVLYLERHAGLSGFAARNAHLADVSLAGMQIGASPAATQLHTVPFVPPLASAAELRARVVEMDQEARQTLRREAVTVRRFVPPRGLGACFAAFTFWTLVQTTYPPNFRPGSLMYDNFYHLAPWWAELNARLGTAVWYFIVLVHGAEAVLMMWPRLRRHNVPAGSALWLRWAASHFFTDGMGTIVRFDRLVADEQAKRDEKKH